MDQKLSAVTIRNHLFEVAERMENELGQERSCLIEGCEQDWEQLPIPDGPLTVGLDGGFVRARHRASWSSNARTKKKRINPRSASVSCRLSTKSHAGGCSNY